MVLECNLLTNINVILAGIPFLISFFHMSSTSNPPHSHNLYFKKKKIETNVILCLQHYVYQSNTSNYIYQKLGLIIHYGTHRCQLQLILQVTLFNWFVFYVTLRKISQSWGARGNSQPLVDGQQRFPWAAWRSQHEVMLNSQWPHW